MSIYGNKGCRCVGLTNLPTLCAYCIEILEPQTPGTLKARQDLYRDCFTFKEWAYKYHNFGEDRFWYLSLNYSSNNEGNPYDKNRKLSVTEGS